MGLITKYWMIDSVILFTCSIVLAYLYVTRKFKYWKKRGVIEIAPTPFVGNFGSCLMAKRSAGLWLQDFYNYSAGLPYMGFYIFDRPCLLIRDTDLIKNILVRDFDYFQNRFASCSVHDPLGNANLFFVKNPAWKVLRSKLSPIYTSARLKKMFELMVDVGNDLETYMNSLNLNGEGMNLEIKDITARFTTDLIATTAFGIRANSLNNPDAEFRKHGRAIFEVSLLRNIELLSLFFLPNIVEPLGFRFMSKANTRFLRDSMWSVMREREQSGQKRNDLIDLIIELRNAYHESADKNIVEFDGDNLVAQLAIFFTGGFETSSSLMSFTLYELAVHPEFQSKLRKEIVEALQQSNGTITYDLVMNLKYLEMVVSETLRKYPVLPFLDRIAGADYKVPNSDFIIEKGTPIFISMIGLHCDPQYFPDPYKFDPERFSEENQKSRKPGVYFPFGEGPHICIGKRIGLLQSKLGLIKFLSQYEFSPCKATLIPMRISAKSFVTTSDGGIFLNIKKFVTP